jgi:hypothetical protein
MKLWPWSVISLTGLSDAGVTRIGSEDQELRPILSIFL